MTFTKLNYCQHLLSSQTNFALTFTWQNICSSERHDAINRYLGSEKLTPRLLREDVKPLICLDQDLRSHRSPNPL